MSEKAKVAVVVDSTSTMPADLIKKYNLHVIPLSILWDGQSLLDGVDITNDQFYSRLESSSSMPTTSQPSVGEFVDFFGKVAETAESIVGIFISNELSGTLASARAACDMLQDLHIEIVDSRSASMGLGLIAVEAAKAAAAGKSAAEVAELARSLVSRTRVLFVVDTLEYLHKGGRIGGAQRLLGSILSIKPVLHLVDGKIEPLDKVRTKKKAINRIIELVTDSGETPVAAAVINAAAPDDAAAMFTTLKSKLPAAADLYTTDLSPVIGVHVGPGAVGITYIVKG